MATTQGPRMAEIWSQSEPIIYKSTASHKFGYVVPEVEPCSRSRTRSRRHSWSRSNSSPRVSLRTGPVESCGQGHKSLRGPYRVRGTKLKHVLSAIKCKRAGVIPRFKDSTGGSQYILFRDRRSKDLTDAGGGRSRRDLTILHTAFREFEEESFGLFSGLASLDSILSGQVESLCVFDHSTMIIFIDLDMTMNDFEALQASFRKQAQSAFFSENSDMVTLDATEFRNLIQTSSVRTTKNSTLETTQVTGPSDTCTVLTVPTVPTVPTVLYRVTRKLLFESGNFFRLFN